MHKNFKNKYIEFQADFFYSAGKNFCDISIDTKKRDKYVPLDFSIIFQVHKWQKGKSIWRIVFVVELGPYSDPKGL